MSDQEVITKKTTKKTLSQKQKDALARGRAKRMENIKNGIKTDSFVELKWIEGLLN